MHTFVPSGVLGGNVFLPLAYSLNPTLPIRQVQEPAAKPAPACYENSDCCLFTEEAHRFLAAQQQAEQPV